MVILLICQRLNTPVSNASAMRPRRSQRRASRAPRALRPYSSPRQTRNHPLPGLATANQRLSEAFLSPISSPSFLLYRQRALFGGAQVSTGGGRKVSSPPPWVISGVQSFLFLSYEKYLTQNAFRHTKSQIEKLSTQKRAAVLRCLIEGNSILATSRITGTAKGTIIKLLEQAGEACTAYQSEHFRNLPCKVLQLDEIWSFVGCREKSKAEAIGRHPATFGHGRAFAPKPN